MRTGAATRRVVAGWQVDEHVPSRQDLPGGFAANGRLSRRELDDRSFLRSGRAMVARELQPWNCQARSVLRGTHVERGGAVPQRWI